MCWHSHQIPRSPYMLRQQSHKTQEQVTRASQIPLMYQQDIRTAGTLGSIQRKKHLALCLKAAVKSSISACFVLVLFSEVFCDVGAVMKYRSERQAACPQRGQIHHTNRYNTAHYKTPACHAFKRAQTATSSDVAFTGQSSLR